MKVGIIGNGFVGKATQILCQDMVVYDKDPNKCLPIGTTLKDLKECRIIFIAVPTPMDNQGKCHTHIVESVVAELRPIIDPTKTFLVLRSTVPPGTSDSLGCYFMPEFLTEKNWEYDFIHCKQWVFGLRKTEAEAEAETQAQAEAKTETQSNELFKLTISELIQEAHQNGQIVSDDLDFVSNREAEMIKYFKNTFLAVKVAYCNEIYQLCQELGIDYEKVRLVATRDERIGDSHTKVPGPDGKKGFGGTCFPKDCNALMTIMENQGLKSYVLKSALDRNVKVDRIEKDWEQNIGRSVI